MHLPDITWLACFDVKPILFLVLSMTCLTLQLLPWSLPISYVRNLFRWWVYLYTRPFRLNCTIFYFPPNHELPRTAWKWWRSSIRRWTWPSQRSNYYQYTKCIYPNASSIGMGVIHPQHSSRTRSHYYWQPFNPWSVAHHQDSILQMHLRHHLLPCLDRLLFVQAHMVYNLILRGLPWH